MKMICFLDHGGLPMTVSASEIELVREPSDRVHDHGMLRLKSGLTIYFGDNSTAARVLKELAELP